MKENQELQILKEVVNIGCNQLNFDEKEKALHCFRTVQVQLNQFAELKETNKELLDAYDRLSADYDKLVKSTEVNEFEKVEGKPKKVITK